MADELTTAPTDDWSKYEVKNTKAPATDDWSQYEVKKNASLPVAKPISPPLSGGSNPILSSLTSGNNPVSYAPITDSQLRQQQREISAKNGNPFDAMTIPSAKRDNTNITTPSIKPVSGEQKLQQEKDAYYNPAVKDISSRDKTLDALYHNQWLMNTPFMGDIIKNKAKETAVKSGGKPLVGDEPAQKGARYNGNNYSTKDKNTLLDQYFSDKPLLPKSKYTPTSDYLSFLPSYSIKGDFDNRIKKGGQDALGDDINQQFDSAIGDVFTKSGKDSDKGYKEFLDNKKPLHANYTEDGILSSALGRNLAGHKVGLAWDKDRNLPYMSISDAWDFEPNAYANKWADNKKEHDRAYVEASLMHKAGNPFKVYDRFYFDPKTKQYIPDDKLPKVKDGGGNVADFKNETQASLSTNPSLRIPQQNVVTKDQYPSNGNPQQQAISERLTKLRSELDPETTAGFDKAIDLATRQPQDNIRGSKEDQEHYQFMQSPVGKVLGTVAYLGSKATKGTLQVAKGAAHYANMAVNPGGAAAGLNPLDETFQKADEVANYGLTKGDESRMGESKILSNLGGLAEFAPAAAGAASTAGATLFLQGAGQASEQLEQAQKNSGQTINPLVKEAFIGGTGLVNKLLMHDMAGIFGKLPAGLRADIAAKVSADAIKEASGKELTGEAFNNLLQSGAREWADKVAKTGVKALQGTSKAALDLSGLAGSNFLLRKGVDQTTDQPIFNDNPADLAQSITEIATQTAPAFGLLGAGRDAMKLTPYSSYKNSVVESLMHDPSEANIEKVKQDLVDHNRNQDTSQQWTRDELDATVSQVDKIADVAKKLPRGIPEKKMVDAVDLVNGREELKQQLGELQKQRSQMDESVNQEPNDGEQLLIDKIDQANDKLKDIVSGKKTTYSIEKGEDGKEDKFFKKTDGKIEPIEESRYNLENLERQAKTKPNEQPSESTPVENTIPETQPTNETGVPEAVGEKPIETTQNNINNKHPHDYPLTEISDSLGIEFPKLETVGYNENSKYTLGSVSKLIDDIDSGKLDFVSKEDREKLANYYNKSIEAIKNEQNKLKENENNQESISKGSQETNGEISPESNGKENNVVQEGDVTRSGVEQSAPETINPTEVQPDVTKKESPKPRRAEAIKNENTKAKAEEAGIELENHVGETRTKEVVDKEATKEIKNGYDSHELVRKILEDNHQASDTEVAILAKHTAMVEKNYQDLTKKLEKDGATMSKREFDDLTAEHDQVSTDYQDVLNADTKTGTGTARALRARQFAVKNNFSLGQMIKNKRSANGGDKLSTEQVADVTKRFDEIEEANKKLQDRVEKLESENARIKADKAIKRIKEGEARIQRKAVTKEALAEDRKKIAAEFSEKLKEMRSQGLNDVFKASAEFLTAAAPYVAKMVRNLAQEGVLEIKDVVARVKEELDLKELSDREVTDLIGGVYSEKKGTKSDIETQIRDLKTQARLMGEIEDAESGLAKQKTPKPKINAKIAELRQRLDELQKGIPPTKEETSLKVSKTNTQKRIVELERKIREKDFSKPEANEIKPDAELVDLRRKADRLMEDYQLQLAKDELANRSMIEKTKDNLLNIASLPRALKASLDFSAVLRQGLFATAGHPKEALTAFKEMFRQTFSEEKYKNWISDLKHTPMYDLMQKSDLYLSDKNNAKLLAREEEFTSNLVDKIPGIGKLIAGSERAYTGYLNVLRSGVFTSEAQNLIRKGYTFENNPEQFKALAKVVNVLTGRGDIPEFLGGKQPKILSAALFSPRFMAARIQTLYLWADPRLTKEARILAAKDIGTTLASGAIILSLASLAGYKVVTDPRSVNFLKIQDKQEHGTSYYDILGGLPQYVRFLAQQTMGQKIPISGNGIVTFGTKKAKNTTRLSEAARFMRGKLSPLVGGGLNLMEGKDVIGQPYHLWPNVPMEFIPLPFTDVQDAYKVGGIDGALKAFIPSQFGVGVSSYNPNSKTRK